MSFAAALFAPILMLFTAVGAIEDSAASSAAPGNDSANGYAEPDQPAEAPEWPIAAIRSFEPLPAAQVHFERRMTIRIAPRSGRVEPRVPFPRDMFAELPREARGPRFRERKIGKCLPVSGIAGVEPNGSNNLILFMRDRRMINAELDGKCRARSFYSGFYLSDSGDGMICVDRDTLHSRNGTACKLSRIRQLVEPDE